MLFVTLYLIVNLLSKAEASKDFIFNSFSFRLLMKQKSRFRGYAQAIARKPWVLAAFCVKIGVFSHNIGYFVDNFISAIFIIVQCGVDVKRR